METFTNPNDTNEFDDYKQLKVILNNVNNLSWRKRILKKVIILLQIQLVT